MDFGIARAVSDAQATMTQTRSGHSAPRSTCRPSRARGERVDARSDLYSAGCLLYELLTGRPPFHPATPPVAIAYQHVRENPIPPSQVDPEIPGWADAIVLKAMAKDPADRYQSAGEDARGHPARAIRHAGGRADPHRDVPGHPADGAGHHGGGPDQRHPRVTATARQDQPPDRGRRRIWLCRS